jgi:hypothetical protein
VVGSRNRDHHRNYSCCLVKINIRAIWLANTANVRFGIIVGHCAMSLRCPLYLQHQTLTVGLQNSFALLVCKAIPIFEESHQCR